MPSRWKKQLRTAAAYAAAAGSALALATTAEAGIMYSGIQNASVTLLTANNGIKSAARRSLKSLGLTLGLRFSQGDKTPGGRGSHAGSARLVALGTKKSAQLLEGTRFPRSLIMLPLGAKIGPSQSASGRYFGNGAAVVYRHSIIPNLGRRCHKHQERPMEAQCDGICGLQSRRGNAERPASFRLLLDSSGVDRPRQAGFSHEIDRDRLGLQHDAQPTD